MQRIIYTRYDGGVSVCSPTSNIVRYLCSGGFWGNPSRGTLDCEIDRQIALGRPEQVTPIFIRALQFGGLTEAEALKVIRDRDCVPYGTGHELWSLADVCSRDRWFRDAWKRSPNGGPIYTHLPSARKIQYKKIKAAVFDYNRDIELDFDATSAPLEISWGVVRDKLRSAETSSDLRQVWPEGVS